MEEKEGDRMKGKKGRWEKVGKKKEKGKKKKKLTKVKARKKVKKFTIKQKKAEKKR